MKAELRGWRISPWLVIFVGLMGLFFIILFRRFTAGLGAISNLSDEMPWGLWIGFDLLSGVALAAGGFTVAALVYILHLERFRPILRSTILTAFLGYIMVILALLVDLGKPWNIWHPIILWNPHSVMFEVGWCVMLYTGVLFLEFLPLVLERFGWRRPMRFLQWLTPVLVLAAVLLSTLHQSSLGTLYVIVPTKLHPLWYSPMLPLLFFVSSVALGLAMTNVEGFLSLRAFGKSLHQSLMVDLGRATAVVLLLYLTIRIEDLVVRKQMAHVFALDTASLFFLAEILLGGVIPMLMLFSRRIRNQPLLLVAAQFMVVLGMIFNRLNVAVTAFQLGTGAAYSPNWMEIALSLAIIAIGFFFFAMAVRYLRVFDEGPLVHPVPTDPYVELSGQPGPTLDSGLREVTGAKHRSG